MSNGVDGSLVLGVRLSDEDLDTQAKRIGEKVRSAIESSLRNSDLLKVIKIEGAGKSQGEVYGNEFIDAYLKVLKTGNAGLARNFEQTFQKIFSRQGEDQANKFISQFEGVLNSRGDKIAAQFARSLGSSLDVGGKETGKRYVDQFEKSFNGIAPKIANEFDRQFQSILAKSNFSTANIFSKSYGDIAKSSKDMAEFFAQNFEAVLRATNSKTASEYAKGFNLAFAKQGTQGGREYSVNFLREIQQGLDKAEQAAQQAKLSVKTTIQPPSSPGNINSILATGGASTAKYFESVYKNVAKASEYSASLFSENFQKILAGSGSKSANEFAKGFEIAFRNGGDRDARNYIQSFNQRLSNEKVNAVKTQIEGPPKPGATAFNNVLNLGNAGSARLFESTFQSVAKQSEKAANEFSEAFQRILASNGPKVANEFARGFQASFSNSGEKSAQQYSSQFQSKLAEAARQAAANMKTTLESPTIPQGFVDAFSRILNKSGASTAQQFSKTWNQIYQTSGEKAANEFQRNFELILKKRGSGNAGNYAKDIAVMYSNAGEKAGVAFIDNFKKYIKKDLNLKGIIGDQVKNLGGFLKDTLSSALGNALSAGFYGIFNGIIGTIKGMFDGMLGGIKSSIEKFLSFDKQMVNLRAISGASPEEVNRVGGEIRKTAIAPGVTSNVEELSKISIELTKAGVPLDAINEKMLKSIALLAQMSGEDLGQTTNTLNQIQSQFNIPMAEITNTMDLLVAGANGSQTSVAELGKALSYASATTVPLGIGLRDNIEMLGLMANAGLEASRGGTAASNMVKNLADEAKTLKQIGVDVFNDNGSIRNYKAIILDLKNALDGLNDKDRSNIMRTIFNERGIRGAEALMTALDGSNVKTKELVKSLDEANGSLDRSGSTASEGISNRFDNLLNKVGEIQTRFGEAFRPGLDALVTFGQQTADYLLENTTLFDTLNQANQEFADFLGQHPEYAQMLADIIADLSQQIFQVLLDQTRQLLEYLKQNPNAVRELAEGFKGFASSVIQILPQVAKLVELLYNGAKFLGLINDGVNNSPDGSGDMGSSGGTSSGAMKSGLFTGPAGSIGVGSEYHIDSKFSKDLPFDRVIAAMDQMANAYAEQGRVIEFSNAAVAGERYNVNDPNRGDLIKRAFDAHSHSLHSNWNSLDYYIPKKEKDRFTSGTDGGEGVEMILPTFPGGKTEFATGGNYGNHALIYDSSGKIVMKTGHGDDRKPIPQTKIHSAVTQGSKGGDSLVDQAIKSSLSMLPGMQFLNPLTKMGLDGMGMMAKGALGLPMGSSAKGSPKRSSSSFSQPDNFAVMTGVSSSASSPSLVTRPKDIASRSDLNIKTAQPVLPSGLTSKGQQLSQYLTNPRIRAFFDAVSVAEGTNKGNKGGYNVSFGGGFNTDLNKNHFNYGRELTPDGRSSASGRYQAMGHSWAEEAEKLGLKKMDPVSQDLFALGRLDMRGILKSIASKDPSKWSEEDWQQVSMEWASVSSPSGANYHGQKTPEGSRFIENYRKSLKKLGTDGVNPIDTFRGKSGLPQYESLNLLGESDPVRELIGLQGAEPSKFDKLRSKREKEIEKMLKEQEKIEKQIAQETKRNAEESLKIKRDVAKKQREQDKRELESKIEKKKIEFQGTELADSYDTAAKISLKRFDNMTELQDYKIVLEDIDRKLKDIEENRSNEAGIDPVIAAYKEQKKAIEGIVEETKKMQDEEIKNIQLADNSKLAIEKKKQAQEEFIKVFERQKKLQELQQAQKLSGIEDGDVRSILENSFKMGNLSIDKTIKTQPLEFEIKKLEDEIKLAKESGLDFSDSLELMQAKLNALKADLEAVNQEFKITGDTIQAESEKILKAKMNSFREAFQTSRSQLLQSSGNSVLDAELNRMKLINAEKERFKKAEADIMALKGTIPESQLNEALQLNKDTNRNTLLGTDSVKGYDDKLFESKVGLLKQNGLGFQAASMEQERAKVQEIMRFRQEMEMLAALKGKIPDEELQSMFQSAQQINGINLQTINNQFETLGNTIKNSVVGELKNFATKAITDFDNIGEAFNSLVDNMLSKALDMLFNQAFAGLFGGGGGFLSKIFGGGGGGGLDVALDVPLLPGLAKGNLEEAMNKERFLSGGLKPQLAVINEREIILSAEQSRRFMNLGLDKIVNYTNGNMPSISASPIVPTSPGSSSVNAPITVNVNGGSNQVDWSKAQSELAPQVEVLFANWVNNQRRDGGMFS